MSRSKRSLSRNLPEYWVEHIALWQCLGFVLLLCLIWVTEWYDIPSRLFGSAPSTFNIYRVCLVSAIVIAAGIITHQRSCPRVDPDICADSMISGWVLCNPSLTL